MTFPNAVSTLAPVRIGIVLAVLLTACSQNEDSGIASMESYDAQVKAEAKARAADTAWRPSTESAGIIKVGEPGQGGAVHNFCLNGEQKVLACWGSSNPSAKDASAQIRVFSAEGKSIESWPLPSTPEAICADRDGTVFVGGAGRILKLDAQGKILASVDSPAASQQVASGRASIEKMAGRKLGDADFENYRSMILQRKLSVTGLAVSGFDVFVACPSTTDFTFSVYRLDRDLQNPTLALKGLRGCCGQMDIQAADGQVWVAHNARHLVECYDREGKKVSGFGRTDRKAADGFGGCCEPKNLRLASDGNVYAAESGPPVAIKRFSRDGKFGGVVAAPSFDSGCVRSTVEVSADCKRFYLLDTGANAIHMFATKN